MISYQQFTLSNGLQVIVHEDASTTLAVMDVIYDVGSRDEDPERTGFAHLFEHLMFGGSVNIPNYDAPLQSVGGENNAFTTPDLTNYYISLPYQNLETAFWLESDRMLSLAFNPQSLEVQRKVVIEEFKQRYLNQPYGDVWLKFRPLIYQQHPYRWATIGKEIKHIEEATLEDVKAFFQNPIQVLRIFAPAHQHVCVGWGRVALAWLPLLGHGVVKPAPIFIKRKALALVSFVGLVCLALACRGAVTHMGHHIAQKLLQGFGAFSWPQRKRPQTWQHFMKTFKRSAVLRVTRVHHIRAVRAANGIAISVHLEQVSPLVRARSFGLLDRVLFGVFVWQF